MSLDVQIGQAEAKGEGSFTAPPLDIEAIKLRAEILDAKSQLKADIYGLIVEIERLRRESDGSR